MTPPDDTTISSELGTDGSGPVERARHEMRSRAHTRALEIAPSVLANVLAQPRRSMPVRTRDDERMFISERVITARLRHRIDEAVSGIAVRRVRLTLGPGHHLEALTIEVIAQYGEQLVEAADLIRRRIDAELDQALGQWSTVIRFVTTDIHVDDVTLEDPALHDPFDDY